MQLRQSVPPDSNFFWRRPWWRRPAMVGAPRLRTGGEHGGAWASMVEGRRCGGSPPPRSGSNAPARARSSIESHAAPPLPRRAPAWRPMVARPGAGLGAPPPHWPPRVSRVGGTRPMHAPSARCTRTWHDPRKSNRNARHGHCARYTPTHHTPYQLVV